MFLHDFSSVLILYGSKLFYFDIIEKVVCVVFYSYIFDFIIHFYNTFINIIPPLTHYLFSEMVITVSLNVYQITVNTNSYNNAIVINKNTRKT